MCHEWRRIRIFSTYLSLLLPVFSILQAQSLRTIDKRFGPFNSSDYDVFAVLPSATISNGALQMTPDASRDKSKYDFLRNNSLENRSGRVMFDHRFKLWDGNSDGRSGNSSGSGVKVASFNTSFVLNIFRFTDTVPGEGMAFVVAPDLNLPPSSVGQFLGLTNYDTDGYPSNYLVAVEFDTFKQDFDPDPNHIGLNINSVKSNKTVSLSDRGLQLATNKTDYFHVWIQYDGRGKLLEVYMVDEDGPIPTKPRPSEPIMAADLDISRVLMQYSYFGFTGSTGTNFQLNCVMGWNLTVEDLGGGGPGRGRHRRATVAIGVSAPVIILISFGAIAYTVHRKQASRSNPSLLAALKRLPGTPTEFQFRVLKNATNNFDEKNKLGKGGFGVVYKGVLPLPETTLEIAVKKFSRDKTTSGEDFLAELTIINRLRHKHLVRLLGWCHKKDVLLLVYEYMPNGSLDSHIFCSPDKPALSWNLRYKIISGVASALHYLHNEYDQKVLHRDLKASNVMLDGEFNVRLGDFGLALAVETGKTSYAHLNGVAGTFGYIAPECFHIGKASRQSDVYGFGAVILEVVCGKRPRVEIGEFQLLVDWVWCLHRDGRLLEAVDDRLGSNYVAEEAERLLLLGLACSHPMANERPKTESIVQILSGSMPVPVVPPFKPPFVWPVLGPVAADGEVSDEETFPTTTSQLVPGYGPFTM